MLQTQLNRAVSRATGEDFQVIHSRGFSLLDECSPLLDEDLESMIIDWDDVECEKLNTKVATPSKKRSFKIPGPSMQQTSPARENVL